MEPSERVLRGWLAATPDALLAVEADGRIVFVNDRAAELFDWSGADLLGQPVELLFADRLIPDGYATAPTPVLRRVEAQRKDGTEFPADVSLRAVRDDTGGLVVFAAVRPVTDRGAEPDRRRPDAVAAEREESHRLESLGQLAGGVAHDFNNLLGVILNYSTLLERRVQDPVAAADLREIRVAAERAAGLTRRLLTFARRDVANPEPLELNEVIDGVAEMLRRTLGERVTLQLDLGPVPLVVADRSQIEQIVLSLAINAREALADSGTITVSTESALRATEAGSVPALVADAVLRVVDDGHGMPPEVVAHAFEPFFTTKARGEGSGLGLATVHGIVLQSGGQVTIDSTVGEGTTVTVVLHGAEGAVPIEHPVAETAPGSQERILLVEDETALRMATVRILSDHGYEVLAACDGVEALEMVDRVGGTIRILVSDVAMPRMGGNELARRLAEQNHTMPMIFLTGYDSGNMVPATGRLLAKPVAEETLLRAIREELGG